MTAVFLALAQTIPATASVIYPCFPETYQPGKYNVTAHPQESGQPRPAGSGETVQLLTHSATYKIDLKTQRFESLSTFRNATDRVTAVAIKLPVRGRQVTWKQIENTHLSFLVNKSKVTPTEDKITRREPTEQQKANGIWAQFYEKNYVINLILKPKETKSVQVNFDSPLPRAGLDGAQRMVVYDTAGADNWADKIKQFNYAIQYSSKVVLQVFASLPEGKWQIGPAGAFMKFYDFEPAEKPHFIFTFYPNSLEPIGGG